MSLINHKYSSSVERYKLAYQKVRGSILAQVVLSFLLSLTNLHEYLPRSYRENTSSKHERCTRNRANRISSLTRV